MEDDSSIYIEESAERRPFSNAVHAANPPIWLLPAVILLIVAGFFVSTIDLGLQPMWIDESIAVLPALSIVEHGIPLSPFDLDYMPWQLEYGLWDPATPLYRYVVGLIFALLGFSETVARGISIACGFLALLPTYVLGKRLLGATPALASIGLIAASPTFWIFAREARHFTFVILLSMTALALLVRCADENATDWSRAGWMIFVAGTVLSQTLGYLILPVAGSMALIVGPRACLPRTRSGWTAVAVVSIIYLALMAAFWHTLPFFHDVSCENRKTGCAPSLLTYFKYLYEFLAPATARFSDAYLYPIALGPVFFLVGLGVVLVGRLPSGVKGRLLLACWLVIPMALLTTRDVKFPRFLFQSTFFPAMLLVALGVCWVAYLVPWPRWRSATLGVLIAGIVIAPQWIQAEKRERNDRPAWRSGTLYALQETIRNAPSDNWQQLRAQTEYLKRHVEPRDAVVAMLDDAGLQHYLGRPVFGYLNSKHSDDFFMELLLETKSKGGKVYLVDPLMHEDFCLTDEPEPQSIRCSRKYRRFNEACARDRAVWADTCRHITPLDWRVETK